MAASATFALKAGVWFRRGRLIMVSPDSQATACPPSGRNSTYRPVQISGASSEFAAGAGHSEHPLKKQVVWNLDDRTAALPRYDEHQIAVDHAPLQVLRQD